MTAKAENQDIVELRTAHIYAVFGVGFVVLGLIFSLGVMTGKKLTAVAIVQKDISLPPAESFMPRSALAKIGEPAQERPEGDAKTLDRPGLAVKAAVQDSKPEAPKVEEPVVAKAAAGAPAAQPGISTNSGEKAFSVQVGAHQSVEDAHKHVEKLKSNGYEAMVVHSEIVGKGTWYRVRVGRYADRDAAKKMRDELEEKLGVQGLVVPAP